MTGSHLRRSPQAEGQAIVERLGGAWTPGGGVCRCPAHDDSTPSLSVRPGRTRLLLHCFAGCAAGEILRALEREGLLDSRAAAPDPLSAGGPPDLRGAAVRLWNESRPLSGTPSERYLAARGLSSDSAELRFNPRTPHGKAPLTRLRPALVACVRDDCGIAGIHRTFLDGEREKCGLGRFGSGAVRLGGHSARLGLAEGVETALSASQLFGVPCWAVLGAERFGSVTIPAQVHSLLLFLDNDAGGRRAEALARAAFRGVRIEAHYPSRSGDDWNDVLRRGPGSS